MSRKNKNNKKSTNNMLSPSDVLRLERNVLADIRGIAHSSPPQRRKKKEPAPRRNRIDVPPQQRVKKSIIGSSYNDGFDVVNKVNQRKSRLEDFDEVCRPAVYGSTAFELGVIQINPGLAAVFPRLSKFATLYEKYRFKKLEYYFVHDVSQFAAQGTKGLTVMSVLYDCTQPQPDNKQQQEMTDPHVIFMPNQSALLRVDCARLHSVGPLLTRSIRPPGGADRKLYDGGVLYLSTQGMVDASEIGELHCRGTVEFYDEIVDSTIRPPANKNTSVVYNTSTTQATTNLYTPCNTLAISYNGAEVVLSGPSNSEIQLPMGNYLVSADVQTTFSGSATQCGVTFEINGNQISPVDYITTFAAGSQTQVCTSATAFVQTVGSGGIEPYALLSVNMWSVFSTGTAVYKLKSLTISLV